MATDIELDPLKLKYITSLMNLGQLKDLTLEGRIGTNLIQIQQYQDIYTILTYETIARREPLPISYQG